MKFNEAWYNLSLEVRQAIAKRVALNYLIIALTCWLPFILLLIFNLYPKLNY